MPLRIGSSRPALDGATEWLNSAASVLDGQPTLIHFWAVSCGICKENMPKVNEWRDKYGTQGLRVVAVHMPRYEADTNMEAVKEALTTYDISEPCAVDNQHQLRDAFANEQGFVPAYYLFNAAGELKSYAAGQFAPTIIKSALDRLFPEAAAVVQS
ncbi:MAG: redoxin family protein [Acidobacteria bacterium]|nr:redoxin family protein [Acidobacteriota bacterium]